MRNPVSFIKGKFKSLYLLILYIYFPVLLLHNMFIDIGFYDLTTDYYGKFVTYWSITDLIKNILQAVFFAGREPLLGAMWFVYVLFIALCVLSFISFVSNKIASEKIMKKMRFATILILAIVSSTLTNVFDFTIPRCSNVFTAILLIYVGMMVRQRYQVQFDSGYVAALCAVIVWHIATTKGFVSLVENAMPNVASLLVSSCASLYVICYLSKKLQSVRVLGGAISWIGNDSFYIMGLHFIGFKICTLLLNAIGMDLDLAQLKAPIGDQYWMIPVYLLISVSFSIAVVTLVRFGKFQIKRIIK